MEAKYRRDCFSCVVLIHFHGAVNLEPATRDAAASESALEQRLGDPYKVTALPLSDIVGMREAGGARPQVVCVVSPPNLSFHFILFHFISFHRRGRVFTGRSPYWSIERSSRRWGAEPPRNPLNSATMSSCSFCARARAVGVLMNSVASLTSFSS